jgi:anaerobic selenocysteine-containing dehydrogenase
MSRQVRLTEPLVRVNGELRPASWDEALDRAAAGLAVPTGS